MKIESTTPASPADLAEWRTCVRRDLAVENVPAELLALFAQTDGFRGDDVVFYSLRESLEHNGLLEVATFAAGYLVIACDGGSRVAALDTRGNGAEVFLNYMGDMSPESMEPTGMPLQEWIAAGCPFEVESPQEYSAVEKVLVRLEAAPATGLPGLLRIRKAFNLDIPLTRLKAICEDLPHDLCQLTYIRALRTLASLPEEAGCMSVRRVGNPDERLPPDFAF
jgi:hypothetical protein